MELEAVQGIPEIQPGDDIGRIVDERIALREDDIVVVASTIVSKAEDRGAALADFPAGDRARELARGIERIVGEPKDPRFAQAVLEESAEVLMEAPFLLTRTHFGHVGVNAGIDRSNTGGAELLLLPRDPTASARRIRDSLSTPTPVIVADTCGRPFRHGQVGVALGWAGMPASRDWRGARDRDGHELAVTVESVIDELAAAANIVTGEAGGGTPAVRVRGFSMADQDGSDNLYRNPETDFVGAALREWVYEP